MAYAVTWPKLPVGYYYNVKTNMVEKIKTERKHAWEGRKSPWNLKRLRRKGK